MKLRYLFLILALVAVVPTCASLFPTSARGALVTMGCPSNNPGPVGGYYQCTIDSNGKLHVINDNTAAPAGTPSAAPAATPSGGLTPLPQAPVNNSYSHCAIAAGASPNAAGVMMIQCGSNGVVYVQCPAAAYPCGFPTPGAAGGGGPSPTSSPPSVGNPPANYFMNSVQPTMAMLGCVWNPGNPTSLTGGSVLPLGCWNGQSGITSGLGLPVGICGNNTNTWNLAGGPCAAVGPLATGGTIGGTNYANGLITVSALYGVNPTSGFTDPIKNVPSPAPTGILAAGYNENGPAGFVLSDTGVPASTCTVASTTPINCVAASAGKRIYLTEIDLTLSQSTTAGNYTASLEYSANTACSSANTTLKTWRFVEGALTGASNSEMLAMGNGSALIAAVVPAGDFLCLVTSSANLTADVNLTYTQAP